MAFFALSIFILGSLSSVAWDLFPNMLIATTDPAYSLTIYHAVSSPYGLRVGAVWFVIGISLVITYTIYVHRSFRGKVELPSSDEGH